MEREGDGKTPSRRVLTTDQSYWLQAGASVHSHKQKKDLRQEEQIWGTLYPTVCSNPRRSQHYLLDCQTHCKGRHMSTPFTKNL